MVTASLVMAFSMMFLLAAGGLATAVFGILELRKTSISAFQHLKANSVGEVVKANTDQLKAEVDLEQMKDAWMKDMAETAKIPQPRKKTVTDVNGRKFDMSELEAL